MENLQLHSESGTMKTHKKANIVTQIAINCGSDTLIPIRNMSIPLVFSIKKVLSNR